MLRPTGQSQRRKHLKKLELVSPIDAFQGARDDFTMYGLADQPHPMEMVLEIHVQTAARGSGKVTDDSR